MFRGFNIKYHYIEVVIEHRDMEILIISIIPQLRQEKKRKFACTQSFELSDLFDDTRILPQKKDDLRLYLLNHGISCANDLQYCESHDLYYIAKCLKVIPRRVFCSSHEIVFQA